MRNNSNMKENFSFKVPSTRLKSLANFMYFWPLISGSLGIDFKGAPLGLRQFLATESPLKMMKVYFSFHLKGIVKWAESCKCNVLLVSRMLWHKRINPSLKVWRFCIWYSLVTFSHNFSFQVYAVPFQWRLLIYIGKNLL